MGIAYIEGIYY